MSFVCAVVGNTTQQDVDLKSLWQQRLSYHMNGRCSGSILYECPEHELYALEWLKKQTAMIVSTTEYPNKFQIKWDYHKAKNEIKITNSDTKGKLCSSCKGVFKKNSGH
jgi:hypothetical protein